MLLNRIKVLLGITNNDNEELLREIIEITEAKILNYINSSELPKQLEFILVELSIKRFNRIGSEGFTSETVDGKTGKLLLKSCFFLSFIEVVFVLP